VFHNRRPAMAFLTQGHVVKMLSGNPDGYCLLLHPIREGQFAGANDVAGAVSLVVGVSSSAPLHGFWRGKPIASQAHASSDDGPVRLRRILSASWMISTLSS